MPTIHTSNPADSLSPATSAWYQRGQLRELCNKQIFVVDEGDPAKEAIVLIHGFPTSSWDFVPMWPALLDNHRLLTLDMEGFGFSQKPDRRGYTIHQQADLFEALLAQSGVTRYHILTHDYGVSVAQELLARQLDGQSKADCLSCCFLNGGLFPETHRALPIQKVMLSRFGKLVNKMTGFAMFKKSFSRVFGEDTKPSEKELREFWEIINFNQGRHLFHNLITYMLDRRTHRERWLQALREAGMPLALINGSVDPVSGAHLVTRYKELECRLDFLVQLQALGHYPHTEDPDAVLNAYLQFIRQIETDSDAEQFRNVDKES